MVCDDGWHIVLQSGVNDSVSVPIGLFDILAENCIENARMKCLGEPSISILVMLQTAPRLVLSICDGGSPTTEECLAELFQQQVQEVDGMGIGLFQAYRQAVAAGFRSS